MERRFARMCLIGCGLIGGSLSFALRRIGAVETVVGVDVSEQVLQEAILRQAIDEGSTDIQWALTGADLVVIAAPVAITDTLIQAVADREELLADGAIVTDVSGTKTRFVKHLAKQFTRASFIGGHPMAGSEKTGISAADARLLENAVYVLTTDESVNQEALQCLQSVLTQAGARVRIMSPEQHDKVVAAISHVPHLIAAALVNQVADLSTLDDAYAQLAAGGFRDITRIASSDPSLWRDISLENKTDILSLIDDWVDRLQWLSSVIADGKSEALFRFFEDARQFRDLLPARSAGAIRSAFSMTVSVPDVPGVIGHVASLLGEHHVSIRNIGILESREGDEGQLLLQFDTILYHDQAATVLEAHGYRIADRV